MAHRWGPAAAAKPKLSQETFDEAVQTNIDDFDMDQAEAVKSAVEEFTSRYDLTFVVTSSTSRDLAMHPVAVATQAIIAAATNLPSLAAALQQLQSVIDAATAEGPTALQEACAVAITSKSLQAVLDSVLSAGAAQPMERTSVIAGLVLARALMAPSAAIRDSFYALAGTTLLMELHTAHMEDIELQAEVARAAECACFKDEPNKEQAVVSGYSASLLKLLSRHCGGAVTSASAADDTTPTSDAAGERPPLSEEFVAGACGVLRSVTTADDERLPSSKAFAHARLLARHHQALKVLLAVLRQLDGTAAAPTLAAVLNTVRQLSANDEICKDFQDVGGVNTCLHLITTLAGQNKDVVKCGLGALRQLANSDGTKKLLAEKGAAGIIMRVVEVYAGDDEVLEPGLGLLAYMTLRQPEVVTICAEAGVVEWLMTCMREVPAISAVQRQCAILMRNMVVRNLELRPEFLTRGAEELLRAAKTAHPRTCSDVGSAALRDLGLDNYGTTLCAED